MLGQEQRQAAIRETAYHKWESAGKPSGRDLEFWLEAEREEGPVCDLVQEASEESFPASDAPAVACDVGPFRKGRRAIGVRGHKGVR